MSQLKIIWDPVQRTQLHYTFPCFKSFSNVGPSMDLFWPKHVVTLE